MSYNIKTFRHCDSDIVGNTIIYLAARSSGAIAQLILLIVLTRFLVPHEFGKWALFTVVLSFSITMICNPVRHTISRFLPVSVDQDAEFRVQMFWLWLNAYLIFLVLIFFVTQFSIDALTFGYLPLALAVLAAGSSDIILEYFRRTLQPRKYLKLFLLRSVLRLISAVGFGYYFQSGEGVIWGMVVGHAMACFSTPLLTQLGFNISDKTELDGFFKKARTWLKYALPLTAAELIMSLISQLDRYMIGYYLGLKQVGLYAATHDLIWMGLHSFTLAAYLSYIPVAIQSFEEKRFDEFRSSMKDGFTLVFGLGVTTSIALYILSVPVSELMLGKEFQIQSSLLVGLFALSHLLFVLKVYCLDVHYSISKSTFSLIGLGVIVTVINLAMNTVLIPEYGKVGAAMATCLSLAIGCILTASFANVAIRNFQGFRAYINGPDISKILVALVAMIIVLLIVPDFSENRKFDLVWLAANILIAGAVFLFVLVALKLDLLRNYRLLGKSL